MWSISNINVLEILLADPLALLSFPNNLTNVQIYAIDVYKSAVNAVKCNPQKFTNIMECAVCGEKHSFINVSG